MTKYLTNNYSVINLYKKPSTKSEVVTQIIFGESFSIFKKTKKWLKIKIKEEKEEKEEKFNVKHIYAICTCTIVAGLLIWASYDLPLVGQLENPVHQHLAQDFIEGSRNHIGIPNVVTSILASYRGYDTFGETVVIYTAGIAVLVLLYDTVTDSSKINIKKKK